MSIPCNWQQGNTINNLLLHSIAQVYCCHIVKTSERYCLKDSPSIVSGIIN